MSLSDFCRGTSSSSAEPAPQKFRPTLWPIAVSAAVLAIAAGVGLDARDASALTRFNVSLDRPTDDLQPGELVTIGIRLSEGRDVYGLGASAYGYDESVLDFESGRAASAINYAIPVPVVVDSSALENYARARNGALSESSIGNNGNRVLFFNGVSLTPTRSHPLDPDVDGIYGTGRDQFRLVFRAIAPGRTILRIGTGYEGDGEVGPGGSLDTSSNVEVAITVIPEPGAGLLFGLGLAGLAMRARHEVSEPSGTKSGRRRPHGQRASRGGPASP
jgi:hypothetical protein